MSELRLVVDGITARSKRWIATSDNAPRKVETTLIETVAMRAQPGKPGRFSRRTS